MGNSFGTGNAENERLRKLIAEKDQHLAEKDQHLAEKDQHLAEKDQQLNESKRFQFLTEYSIPDGAFIGKEYNTATRLSLIDNAIGMTKVICDYQLRVFPSPVFTQLARTAEEHEIPCDIADMSPPEVSLAAQARSSQFTFRQTFTPETSVEETRYQRLSQLTIDGHVDLNFVEFHTEPQKELIRNLMIHILFEPICIQALALLMANPTGLANLKHGFDAVVRYFSLQRSPPPLAFRRLWLFAELIAGVELVSEDITWHIPQPDYENLLDEDVYVTMRLSKPCHRHGLLNNMLGTRGCIQTTRRSVHIKQLIGRFNAMINRTLTNNAQRDFLAGVCARWSERDTEGNFAVEGEEGLTEPREREVRAIVTTLIEALSKHNLSLQNFDRIQRTLDPDRAETSFAGLRPPGLEVIVRNKFSWATEPVVVHHGCSSHDVLNLVQAFVESLNSAAMLTHTSDHANPSLGDRVAALGVFGFQFAHIHPFNDGNGRTARYLFQAAMHACGVPAAIAGAPHSLIIHRSRRLRELFYRSQDNISMQLMRVIEQKDPLIKMRPDCEVQKDFHSFFGYHSPSSVYFAYYDATVFSAAALEAALAVHCFIDASMQLEAILSSLKQFNCSNSTLEEFTTLGNILMKGPMDSAQSALHTTMMRRYPPCYDSPTQPWELGEWVDTRQWMMTHEDCSEDLKQTLKELTSE
ncbi:Fic/DOC family [Carpediemonas membranifera]|uniref:Fic/DOC family n=1 Tax=Carpediemonas membranifera TaxID=201153 RepID=A0A8J6APZ5_9EUKA|nr:Fic/DOC family [Carpediemonas membranifera]|eukprot:KAG9390751.1 Fic/DOC family [Carpediemonas membranifera]